MIPYEIIYLIYNFADMETRIKINKAFNIPFTIANPLSNNLGKCILMKDQLIVTTLYATNIKKTQSPFNFLMRGH